MSCSTIPVVISEPEDVADTLEQLAAYLRLDLEENFWAVYFALVRVVWHVSRMR